MIVAPNSPSARAKESTAPDTRPGRTSGRVTRRKTVVGRAPSVAATDLVAAAGRAQRALEADHEERQGDERLRHHHGGGGERDLDAEHLERLAEQPAPAERVEQGDAADDRRQHQRQQDQGPEQVLAGELGPGQHHGHRHAEDDAEQGAGGRRPQAQQQRGHARTRR